MMNKWFESRVPTNLGGGGDIQELLGRNRAIEQLE